MADPVTFSLIIPTISRPTLARSLASLRGQDWRPGDEIIVVGDGPQSIAREVWEQFKLPGRYHDVVGPSNDWGHAPRNLTMPMAIGSHLVALDDDDEMTPGALAVVRRAIEAAPDRPHIFRMEGAPIVGTVWKERVIAEANVGTPMLVLPNTPGKIGQYAPRYGGDFDFIRDTCAHYPNGPVWHEEVICSVRPWRTL